MSGSNTNINLVYNDIVLVMASISLIASVIFCWSFIRYKNKTRALYAILILNIYDIISPIMIFLAYLVNDNTARMVFSYTELVSSQFTLFWSTALAVFTYLVLNHKIVINLKAWMIPILLICLGISLPIPIM